MGLADVIRAGVATAKALTLDLQVSVTHTPWIGQDTNGAMIPGPTATLKAIVERKQRMVRTPSGQEVLSQYYVAFLEQVAPNGAAGRTEPIDVKDALVLPGGVTGPILSIVGFYDAGTGYPFFTEVYLG